MKEGETTEPGTSGEELKSSDKEKRSEPVMLSSLRPRKASQPFPTPIPTGEGTSGQSPGGERPGIPVPSPDAATQEIPSDAEDDDASAGQSIGEQTPQSSEGEDVAPAEDAEPELMDTVPVTEQSSKQEAPEQGQLLEACSACGTLIDVTDEAPFAKIHCPSCGQALRARKQFNHYKLLELIGQGGMGHVFKAQDCNLNRLVALKVLKKELASSPEEREKLAEESRITASLNHPHIVKVFSFGEDHGQFYMAMELVAQNSLDELLTLQRRVPEAQVLEVGIQIAEGLQAAYEKGLLHRDIKPGNILFADAHTAKLVDFGLALVADEAAAAIGEIWGTPYYIAPEKLDNQPEDLRSDIYSLGGTLFHALAGRPPYEADTASMVALKQLKSQPVSLQSFAPDVSSETSYVVNRMLAKNADERYESYEELVEHLQYARTKLLERIQKPPQPKARVVLENRQTRTFAAVISLVLLGAVLAAGVAVYVFRDRLFSGAGRTAVTFVASDYDASFREAVALANELRFDEAVAAFRAMADTPGVPQPDRNWTLMNLGLATLLAGNGPEAAEIFDDIHRKGLYSEKPGQIALANFFSEAARLLSSPDKTIHAQTARLYSASSEEAFGLLLFAMHNWQLGDFANATPILKQFLAGRIPKNPPWIGDYKTLAKIYAEDVKILEGLDKRVAEAKDAAAREALAGDLNDARLQIRTGDRASERLDKISEDLKNR